MNQPTEQAAEAAQLPVREKCSPAELELCACWIDEHGDPAEWTPEVRHTYANTIANCRAAGAL